ncbi:MAG TPA: hypothetical protein VIU61_31060 [Kofleriaceae bacterium]
MPSIARLALVASIFACKSEPAKAPKVAPDASVIDAPVLPAHTSYPDLGAALAATIPATARVVGVGELHARVDRAAVKQTALAAFTAALPAIGAKVSDLVVETWVVDPKCGQTAVKATQKIETAVKRPAATKNEIAVLADAARAAKIQPHAMTLQCKDYEMIAPAKGEPDPVAMLTLTTKELWRVASSAVTYRDKAAEPRPWIVVYGGALHNDLYPAEGVAEWSYATAIDATTRGRYVELDLIVPEFAEAAETAKQEPWFPLVAGAKQVRVWKRNERSFVVILPRGT